MCVAKCMTLPVNVFFRAIWCCLLLGFGPFIRWENHSWAMETGKGFGWKMVDRELGVSKKEVSNRFLQVYYRVR